MTTVEQEEMAVLRKISNAIPPDNKNAQQEKAKDDFDLFGEYVATKMRKHSHKLEEDDMEMIEYEITTTLMKKFKKQSNRNNVNTTPHGLTIISITWSPWSQQIRHYMGILLLIITHSANKI